MFRPYKIKGPALKRGKYVISLKLKLRKSSLRRSPQSREAFPASWLFRKPLKPGFFRKICPSYALPLQQQLIGKKLRVFVAYPRWARLSPKLGSLRQFRALHYEKSLFWIRVVVQKILKRHESGLGRRVSRFTQKPLLSIGMPYSFLREA